MSYIIFILLVTALTGSGLLNSNNFLIAILIGFVLICIGGLLLIESDEADRKRRESEEKGDDD